MLTRDYKIRVFMLFFAFSVLFAIVLVRLFLLQIKQKDFFAHLAKHQYELELTLNPPRALMYDRTGRRAVTFNRYVNSAFLLPHQLLEPAKVETFLKRQYPDVLRRIKAHPEKQFVWLDRKVSPVQYTHLTKTGLKDIQFLEEHQRFYPLQSLCHVLGFTDIDNMGTAGLELGFTQKLSGSPSKIKIEKDARSGLFYFNKQVREHGKKGVPVTVTIDGILQSMAHYELKQCVDKLKAKGGSVVIMDPDSGHVLSMANYPDFDPNVKSVSSLESMKNIAVCECYELGSVMKAFCAMAAFEEKEVTFDEIIDCEGRFANVNGVRVENPTFALLRILAEHDNKLPFCDVLRYSSNVGIAKVAQRLGPRLYTHLRRLGFGSKTGIQFPGERSGFINPPDRWSRPSLIVMSFGYEMMLTIVQLAKAFSIIANGGFSVDPTIIFDNKEMPKKVRLYSESTIAQMKTILGRVCEKYPIPGFTVMGKTGTARCVKGGKYSDKDHHYSFAGIVEKDGYRRVIVTFIREPEKTSLWASQVTLPLFTAIAQRMVVRDVVQGVVKGTSSVC